MNEPIHVPGPALVEDCTVYTLNDMGTNRFSANVQPGYTTLIKTSAEECASTARVLAAAFNAFDSAAKKLGLNAVELAERMADGAIAELIEAVEAAKELSNWFMKHSRQAEHAHSELKEPLDQTSGWKELVDAGYNGVMASYHQQFDEALAMVKGDS